MNTTTREWDIVKQVIQRYAQFKPSHGDIRLDTVFDDTQNRYALMQVGWDRVDFRMPEFEVKIFSKVRLGICLIPLKYFSPTLIKMKRCVTTWQLI